MTLRALEPEDIDFLYWLENETFAVGGERYAVAFCKASFGGLLYRAKQDIYEAKQFRYVIADDDNTAMGCVDIYDFSPKHLRAFGGDCFTPTIPRNGLRHHSSYLTN